MKRWISFLVAMAFLLGCAVQVSAFEKPVNILLLGTDSLGYEMVTGSEEMSRADAIYVLNLRPDTGAINLLSVERDYLVDLPGELGENKLATATYFGGPEMCLDAVNGLFELDIDMYLQADITQLIQAVDAMGGISVEIKANEVDPTNAFIDAIRNYFNLTHVSEGVNQLMGPETWAFLAIRDKSIDEVESNKDRNDRQKRAITASLERLNAMTFDEAMAAVDVVLSFVKTNITLSDILSLVQIAQRANTSDFVYMRTPSTAYMRTRAGLHQVVVADDMPLEISAVKAFLYE